MSEKAYFLDSKEEFDTLDHYGKALNSLESLADYVYVVYRDLVVHDENLRNEDAIKKETEAEEASRQAHEENALA